MRAPAMSKLLVRSEPPDADGRVLAVTPESAGWSYVGFEVFRVPAGARLARHSPDRESCVVLLSGRVHVAAGEREWRDQGGRPSVFDGPPTALYVPPGLGWSTEAATAAEVAVCTAPAEHGAELRLLGPDTVRHESRGSGGEAREIDHILMENEPAESLLVTEVVTPAGHWSSYPPHKHDTDDPPRETYLEETYYHRIRPAGGFAFQRVYTADRSLDVSLAPGDGDVVLVPRGFHPVAAGARHDLYYLNVMAGPVREWRITADPDFA
jgi:5-deoxy-glucuronate isomerase